MNIVLAAILMIVAIFLVFGSKDSGKSGQEFIKSKPFKISLLIILLTIGAFFYPKLNEKLNRFRNKI